jgi:YVTN family beta-propeller protein
MRLTHSIRFAFSMLIFLLVILLNRPGIVDAAPQSSYAVDGITVNSFPVDIAVNPDEDRLYVINEFSNTVSVIDTKTDQIIKTIEVGAMPYGIEVDDVSDRVYVSSIESNKISVIDGSTNNVVHEISGVSTPVALEVNSLKSLIYVSNIDNGTVSVIDGVNNKVKSNIKVGNAPFAMAVYSISKTIDYIYVANYASDSVSLLKYAPGGDSSSPFELVKNIMVDSPSGVTIDEKKGIAYVTSRDEGQLFAINASTGSLYKSSKVGSRPVGLDVNDDNGMIYVSNTADNTVSVIEHNGQSLREIKVITVNPNVDPDVERPLPLILNFPNVASFVDIDRGSNIIYVSNTDSNKISLIDGTVNELLMGTNFSILPPDSGEIVCNGKPYQNGEYSRFPNSVELKCEARAKGLFPIPGFEYFSIFPTVYFSKWLSDPNTADPSNSTDHVEIFTLKGFGNVQAHFEEVPDFFQVMTVGIAILSAGAAAAYSKREWFHKRRYLTKYMQKVESAYRISRNNKDESLKLLEELKKISRKLFLQDKLSESDYFELCKRIEQYLIRIMSERKESDG